MRLEVLGSEDSGLWNKVIDKSINGTLYHTWEWLGIVEEHTRSKLFALVYFDSDDDTPFGAMPIFYKKRFGVKMFFSPPPGSGITLGPVFLDKSYRERRFHLVYLDFQADIDRFIKELGTNYTFIITSPGILDFRPFLWAGYSVSPCYTYRIDLSQGEEIVWRNLGANVKQHIRRAENDGVDIIETTDISRLDDIYSALEKRYAKRHLNITTQKEYVRQLVEQFGRSAINMVVAIQNGKMVGGQIIVAYKDTVALWFGGSRNESSKSAANELILWRVIKDALNKGYHWLDMVGANTRHLCYFKAGFSPEISLYFQIRKADLLGSLAENAYLLMRKRIYLKWPDDSKT
jgi:hypothetical protein